ncbi:LOW QUALITY PROTEIN: Myb_DNA-bind_3 domain-containing protein [Cephalotus follicularis]|uniref:Myb_DNA-bind_3 domain-containing protein n=1 Tax=Cephalotus follicularis TaxID=3775 RepID=A0A1Q3D9X1_CEPFO|nr:LOW QUALITY PROTEIN: Myb_DNA-bind_3 domain-containing protein [Cephalotus follicularis]
MECLLLEILADEALKGNKPTNTFKTSSFIRLNQISLKFEVKCTADNMTNHLKIVKSTWNVIATLRGKRELGWDNTLKMITAGRQSYREEVTRNRKIELYDKMTLVVGKDMATGSFAKSFVDVDMQENINVDYLAGEEEKHKEGARGWGGVKGKQTSMATSSQARSQRKRNRDEFPQLDLVAAQLGEIAVVISKLCRNELIVDDLYKEVMKIEGFEVLVLANAFDYLVDNEKQAKSFIVKNVIFKMSFLKGVD